MPSATAPPGRTAPHVIIIGAGVAGLSCARELLDTNRNFNVTVLEARQRPGGRILTHWLDGTDPDVPDAEPPSSSAPMHPEPPASGRPRRHDFHALATGSALPNRTNSDGSARLAVDMGASIMHGCGDDNQLVLRRAIHDRIRAPIVAGSGFYESTEHALWYNDKTAKRIPSDRVVDVHNIFFMASRYMAAVASQSDDGAADMHSIFRCGVDYVCKHLGSRELTSVERDILHKICARSVGYCSPMSSMALMQASAGMEVAGTDAHIGIPYEEDDPPFPGEVPAMNPSGIKQQAVRLEKSVMSTQKPSRNVVASKRGGPGDRIVLDGYTPFLIDRLSENVDIRLGQSVVSVAKGFRDPVNTAPEPPPEPTGRVGRPRKRTRPAQSNGSWTKDPEVATRNILVSTRTGELFQGDFVVVTVPLGVLKEKNEQSQILFDPPLSPEKQEAISSMGMGVHNKVVLRFKSEDVFWPPSIPQLNCLDERFQFFNLHSYGKTGVLLVHVFAESGFAENYWSMSDECVVAEILSVLGGMFCTQTEGGFGEDNMDVPMTPGSGQMMMGRKEALAKTKTARLMGICESCRKTISNFGGRCEHCGFEGSSFPLMSEGGLGEGLGKPVMPDAAPAIAELENGTDTLILASRVVTWDTLPAPEEFVVTRWGEDPFSLGSYSYMPCGSSWPMIDQLAAYEPRGAAHPYLFFAGEHCSDLGWQCVHGAFETGIRAAKEILECFDEESHPVQAPTAAVRQEKRPAPQPRPTTTKPVIVPTDQFWTPERERCLTRALIGYSDVYGNKSDVIDEMAYALYSFKKEPTDIPVERVRELVHQRIHNRAAMDDAEAAVFLKFHEMDEKSAGEDYFPRPFEEVNSRARLLGLNGSKLKDKYSEHVINELKNFAKPVSENRISYRETLRKVALTIYVKDGGLMTKRCLSEYLRTQVFGNGPQKELFLEKYLAPDVGNGQAANGEGADG